MLKNTLSLETERLILRPHKLSDFDHCKSMWESEIVTRYTIGKPSTAQQTWARILNYLGHWTLMGYGYWAIEEKKTKVFIGELGFADFKREMNPSIQGIPEMGWALTPSHHGLGFAKEAIEAAIKWGDKNLPSKKTVCIINPENTRSIRLAERFGFKWTQDTSYMGSTIKLFSRNSVEDAGETISKI